MDLITPHNSATLDEIAETVLMPGDPKRSRFIAENLLENAVLVNDIRGVQGYTGTYKGKKLTTMASGIGIPAMGLYCYELFNMFDVKNIIRVGTVGSINPDVHTRDVIFAEEAFMNSNFYEQLNFIEGYRAKATKELLDAGIAIAEKEGISYHKGAVLTMELYYSMQEDIVEYWNNKGALGFEMETACLYAHADMLGKNALSILSVSNNILTGEEMDPADRENTFTDMLKIALELAYEL